MQNQQIIDFIKNRRSMPRLTTPVPTDEQIYQAIDVALTAPDHKLLRPLRFVVLQNDGLNQLGNALKQATLANGETDEKAITKAEKMPHRAEMIIVCISDFKENPKVPEFEQMLSIGAGVQNLLLALQAQGFASIWRSGNLMNAPQVRQLFDIQEKDMIAGFVYVGTAGAELPERESVDSANFVQFIR